MEILFPIHTSVLREPFARVIRREVELRGGLDPIQLNQVVEGPGDYQATLADEIAAAGQMTAETAKRRLWSILNGRERSRKGVSQPVYFVEFDTADKILSALGLTHLWHTELRDAIVLAVCSSCGVERDEFTPDCSRCKERAEKRRKYEREKAQKLAAAPTLGGRREPHGSTRTGGRAGGGKDNVREAA